MTDKQDEEGYREAELRKNRDKEELLSYICKMCCELHRMALEGDEPFLAYLLEMAYLEAKRELECQS